MSADITLLRSVSENAAIKLRRYRLHQAAPLIEATSSMAKCRTMAEQIGIGADTLYRLGRQAELTLIQGIGVIYADLLGYLGVSSLEDLAAASAETLHARMYAADGSRIAWRLPSQRELETWIEQARQQQRKSIPELKTRRLNTMAFDALSLWNDGEPKEEILRFVRATTLEDSPAYVAPMDRIAVFDNDGTLWVEQPIYTQLTFALDRMAAVAAEHPEWRTDPALAAALDRDIEQLAAHGMEGVAKIVAASHTGISTENLTAAVREWIATARHPHFDRLYTDLIYQPQLELMDYLRAHGYRTYIVSGGGVEFLRAWAEDIYGIPPEQVIGSSVKTAYEVQDGRGVLIQLPEIDLVNDGPGKPVGINKFIGRRPTIAVGNSDGDLEMLHYTTSGDGPHLGIYIHHDDGEREFAYDRGAIIGSLEKGLDQAGENGWIVVSMKHDWKQIFR